MHKTRFLTALAVLTGIAPVFGQQPTSSTPAVRAILRPDSHHVPIGRAVRVRFTLENSGDEPVTLMLPDTKPAIPSPEAGLPIAYLFGKGGGFSLATTTGRRWDQPVGYRTPAEAPILMIAPQGSVGVNVDLRDYFPALRGAGQYRFNWQPAYSQVMPSDPVIINIAPLKQAQIITDEGTMTVRFLYADAPNHVANFLELAGNGFYNGKTFHRLEPGYLLQGGCPRGDGTGIRLDGKRVAAEFNGHSMRKGTVAMALLEDDPDSASCQFFICNTRQKEWDGLYTIFGELVEDESYETLDRLMATAVDDASARPVKPLVMRTVRIVDAPIDGNP